MDGLPVTIRLLDPPLHEFVPAAARRSAASWPRASASRSRSSTSAREDLHESNPMMGHRGVRLGITYPGDHRDAGPGDLRGRRRTDQGRQEVLPEIMIPVVGAVNELEQPEGDRRAGLRRGLQAKSASRRSRTSYGTMIEIPRAALTGRQDRRGRGVLLLRHQRPDADDLRLLAATTSAASCPTTSTRRSCPPTRSRRSTRTASGSSSRWASSAAAPRAPSSRSASAASTAASRVGRVLPPVGMDYVSCSPFRVPIARLAAAHAALKG